MLQIDSSFLGMTHFDKLSVTGLFMILSHDSVCIFFLIRMDMDRFFRSWVQLLPALVFLQLQFRHLRAQIYLFHWRHSLARLYPLLLCWHGCGSYLFFAGGPLSNLHPAAME